MPRKRSDSNIEITLPDGYLVTVPNGSTAETVVAAIKALEQHSDGLNKKKEQWRHEAHLLHTALLMACTDLCGDGYEAVDISREYIDEAEGMLEFLMSLPEEERGQIVDLAKVRKRKEDEKGKD